MDDGQGQGAAAGIQAEFLLVTATEGTALMECPPDPATGDQAAAGAPRITPQRSGRGSVVLNGKRLKNCPR